MIEEKIPDETEIKRSWTELDNNHPLNFKDRFISESNLLYFFPETQYKLGSVNQNNNNLMITILDENDETCVEFTIFFSSKDKDEDKDEDKDKEIYVDFLTKCNQTGTNNLKRVEELAKSLGFNSVRLQDESRLRICEYISYSLATLYILTRGVSWYNTLGYRSPSHEDNVEYNKKQISMSIKDAFQELKIDLPKNQKDAMASLFPAKERKNNAFLKKSVQEVFQKIENYIKSNQDKCNVDKVFDNMDIFASLIDQFQDLLQYKTFPLRKYLEHEETSDSERSKKFRSKGGKKQTRRKTRRRRKISRKLKKRIL